MIVRFVLLFVAGLISQVFSQAQPGSSLERATGADDLFSQPTFVMRNYAYPGTAAGQVHLDVRLAMVYDLLQFVKEAPDRYRAAYEITAAIVDHKGNQVAGKISRNEIVVASFEETNSRQQTRGEVIGLDIPPGDYTLTLDLMDLDTQKHLRREEEIKVADFIGGQLQVSSLAFVNYIRPVANRDSLFFNLSSIFRPRRELHGLYFELAGIPPGRDSAAVRYTIRNYRDEKVSVWTEKLAAGTNAHLVDMERWTRNPGHYSLEVEVRDNATSRARKESFIVMSSAAAFDSLAPAVPTSLLEPLRYIARSSEYKKIAGAPESQHDSLIADFWKQRDPTPNTAENELLREFNQRLDFAIAHFSVPRLGRAGWQTDRGRIYIQYGPPSDVQRQTHSVHSDRRYEIWYYKSIDRSFVFRERNGTGDFELLGQQ